MSDSKSEKIISRRNFLRAGLIGTAALPLASCDKFDFLADKNNPVRQAMLGANSLTYRVQRLILGRNALAQEFSPTEIRQGQRPNGSTNPNTGEYVRHRDSEFVNYQLEVTGLVDTPRSYSLTQLRNMPSRTQITRHDCVEGWSAIAKWQGTPLAAILKEVGVKPAARYVRFHCFDNYRGRPGATQYYETIDLIDARHPQTILAYALNDKALPVSNGAPLRARVERQLGYKMAKYLKGIELISSFENIESGKGGYWPDRGYEWYAGI